MNFLDFAALLQLLDDARQKRRPRCFSSMPCAISRMLAGCESVARYAITCSRSDLVRDGRFFVGLVVNWRFMAGCHTVHAQANGICARVAKLAFAARRRRSFSSAGMSRLVAARVGQIQRRTILPSGSRSSAGAYSPSSSRRHQLPVSRFVFMSVNQY